MNKNTMISGDIAETKKEISNINNNIKTLESKLHKSEVDRLYLRKQYLVLEEKNIELNNKFDKEVKSLNNYIKYLFMIVLLNIIAISILHFFK